MASFSTGEEAWVQRLGNLRNTIRQEMIRRQLAEHVTSQMSVLSARQARAAGFDLELVDGSIKALDEVLGDRRFDVVCAHGLLMYLDDRRAQL